MYEQITSMKRALAVRYTLVLYSTCLRSEHIYRLIIDLSDKHDKTSYYYILQVINQAERFLALLQLFVELNSSFSHIPLGDFFSTCFLVLTNCKDDGIIKFLFSADMLVCPFSYASL